MGPHFGYVNHNPGNIRWNTHDKWQGLAPNPRYVPEWDKSGIGFFRFTAPEWGIRAVAKTLLTYRSKYGDDTLQELFSRYAPTGDHANDPHKYAVFVADQIGADIDEAVDLSDRAVMRALLSAIFKMETGQAPQYPDSVYEKALDLAGFAHETKPAPAPTHKPWWRFW
jgi:hypothetical protein